MGILDGKVALVTGAGRKRGIGRATAVELGRQGATVVVTDYARPGGAKMMDRATTSADLDEVRSAASDVRDAGGHDALALRLDVTDPQECAAAVTSAVETFGRLDIVVNNAGTPLGAQAFDDLTDRDWRISWDVNTMGCVHMISAALQPFRVQGGGVVVNIASMAGLIGLPRFAAYCATKFAVVGLTKALALELGPENVRVNAVCPGDIDTDMADIALDQIERNTGVRPPDQGAPIALGRRGKASDVARLVAFLASSQADYITGATIRIDGASPFGL